jgi:hypothetical protein
LNDGASFAFAGESVPAPQAVCNTRAMVRAGTMAAVRDVAKRLEANQFESHVDEGQAGCDPRRCLVFSIDRNTV